MLELTKLNDDRGYDPYNHVGCDMQPEIKPLGDKIFVMDAKMLKLFTDDMVFNARSTMTDLVRPRFDTLMGCRVVTPQIFANCDA